MSISLAKDQMMGSQHFGHDTEHEHDQDEVVDQNVHMAFQGDHFNVEDMNEEES